MQKILLCGNGVNIKFNKKFILIEFINLLLNKNELMNFARQLPEFKHINEFNWYSNNNSNDKNEIEDFIFIINEYKDKIEVAKDQFIYHGVEIVFLELFNAIEEYMLWEESENSYQQFEKTFKILFFKYIWKLQHDLKYEFNSYLFNRFKNYLTNYEKIVTLNYDTILENELKIDKRKIVHWHGSINENEDGTLDFSNCLLDTIRNPKSLHSIKQIPLFQKYKNHKNKYELDIIGLNPLNDENVFALFINSQICNNINFYYHTKNDIKNLEKVLKKIQYTSLTIEDNKVKLKIKEKQEFLLEIIEQKRFILIFKDGNSIKVNLYHSDIFWNKCEESFSNKFHGSYFENWN